MSNTENPHKERGGRAEPGARLGDDAPPDIREPIDTIAPWTIKAVTTRTRKAIVRAAEIEGVTVGQWLDRRVEEWIADGSPTVLQTPSAPTRPPSPSYRRVDDALKWAQVAHLAGADSALAQLADSWAESQLRTRTRRLMHEQATPPDPTSP